MTLESNILVNKFNITLFFLQHMNETIFQIEITRIIFVFRTNRHFGLQLILLWRFFTPI